jgi:hypothetical protein
MDLRYNMGFRTCVMCKIHIYLILETLMLCILIQWLNYMKFWVHFRLMFHQCYWHRPLNYLYHASYENNQVRNISNHSGLWALRALCTHTLHSGMSYKVTKPFQRNLYSLNICNRTEGLYYRRGIARALCRSYSTLT